LCQDDVRELNGYLAAKPEVSRHNERQAGTNKFVARKNKDRINPITLSYLAKAWGVGSNDPLNVLKRQAELGKPKQDPVPSVTQTSVIESLEAAKVRYTAKSLFMEHRVRERKKEENGLVLLVVDESSSSSNIRANQQYVFREEAKAEWVMLSLEEKNYWELQAQGKAARQPQIRDDIIENKRANPFKSYEQLCYDIDSWATVTTIQGWFTKQGARMMYAERALPLLTSVERAKHVTFCRRLCNNWGLAAAEQQKILWIHYDEKWFYSWISRQAANTCELLGLEKSHTYHYDKCHIDKVMAVAFTAFAFDSNRIEDGGKGVKLGLYRVQESRAAKKLVKKNRRDEEWTIRWRHRSR
jgi:hypothetical protein